MDFAYRVESSMFYIQNSMKQFFSEKRKLWESKLEVTFACNNAECHILHISIMK